MPVFELAAFAVRVRFVLSVIEATVPITTPVVLVIMLPAASSVVKDVPDPVTAVEELDVVMVPVLETPAQDSAAFQFPPDDVDVIVAARPVVAQSPISIIEKSNNRRTRSVIASLPVRTSFDFISPLQDNFP